MDVPPCVADVFHEPQLSKPQGLGKGRRRNECRNEGSWQRFFGVELGNVGMRFSPALLRRLANVSFVETQWMVHRIRPSQNPLVAFGWGAYRSHSPAQCDEKKSYFGHFEKEEGI
ncbi:uncharacterized [Tachysurus ichikawai]